MFGLLETDISLITTQIMKYSTVTQVIIFGSRAKGNYKAGSDIDLALKGDLITYDVVQSINSELNADLPLPYHFDVVNYHTLTNNDLIAHIDRVGLILFDRPKTIDTPLLQEYTSSVSFFEKEKKRPTSL